MKHREITIEQVTIVCLPRLGCRRKVDEDSMIDLRNWISVEEYLTRVLVTLGDIRNIKDSGCVAATLDLEETIVLVS